MYKKEQNISTNKKLLQIGTLAGNLMLKHTYNQFPSDIFVILETAGAKLTIGKNNVP